MTVSLADRPRILVIRRDNIGDLLCTTPLIAALRRAYPHGHIAVLVNRYNAPVLAGNSHLDEVWAYTKAKHARGSPLAALWEQARIFWGLRAARYDLVINANPSPQRRTARLVRFIRPRHAIGVVDASDGVARRTYDLAVDAHTILGRHHVERVFALLQPLGIQDRPGPMVLTPPTIREEKASLAPAVGVHISSRKPCNRWPLASFEALIRGLQQRGYAIRLLWAPGVANDPLHPGDDASAAALVRRLEHVVEPCPTPTLEALIEGLATLDLMVCSDGGALHMAAALGKPTVALFGCTDPTQWGPWGVPCRVLSGAGDVMGIRVEEVMHAVDDLAIATWSSRTP